MSDLPIAVIVAAADNDVIGRNNALPWDLPADLAHFRRVTMGKPILMGRKTFESLGRPLPGRHNIVVTRDSTYSAAGCTVVYSVDQALLAASRHSEAMVIGGAALYGQLMTKAQRLYLTLVDGEFEGDVFFPAVAADEWREIERESRDPDERNPYPYSFVVMERVKEPGTLEATATRV